MGKSLRRSESASRRHCHDAIAVGTPPVTLADEDREHLEDLVAELLVAQLEQDDEATVR